MKKSLSLAIGISLLTAVFAAPSAGAATVTQCKRKVYSGANSPVYVTSARGLTCSSAAREQRRYKWTGKNTFRTPGGYRCASSGRGAVGFQIRCIKGARAYRIEFSED